MKVARFSGWSTLGTLNTSNVTDFASHWHGKRTIAAAQDIYKAIPAGGMPFTVVAHLVGAVVVVTLPSPP